MAKSPRLPEQPSAVFFISLHVGGVNCFAMIAAVSRKGAETRLGLNFVTQPEVCF